MGIGDKCAAVFGFCCIFGVSLICQGVGLFSPRWVTPNSTVDCNLGLITSSCGTKEALRKSQVVLGLEATSFAVILLTNVVFLVFMCCCHDEDDDEDSSGVSGCCMGCCTILYPIAGILILIGCVITAAEYSTSQLGWSFYLCIASGCYIILESLCCCCALCAALKGDGSSSSQNYDPSPNRGYDNTVAVTSSSRDLGVPDRRHSIRGIAENTEVVGMVTEHGFLFIARKVQHVFHISN